MTDTREPVAERAHDERTTHGNPPQVAPLSIQSAKHGLAAYFGVPVDAIEITIRG